MGRGEGAAAAQGAALGAAGPDAPVKSRTMANEALRAAAARKAPKRDHDPARGPVLRHDLAVTARRTVPYLLIGLVVFLLLVPVSTVAFYDQSIFNLTYTHDQLKFRFFLEDVRYLVLAAAVAFGAVLAFGLFRFVTIRSESTACFSLSLSRGRLFAVRVACGLSAVFVAVALPMAVSLVLNLVALGESPGIYEHWAFVTAGVFLTGAVSFIVASLALALSGTVAESVLCYAALVGCVSVVAFAFDQMAGTLLLGNPYGATLIGSSDTVADSVLSMAMPLNPLLFFADAAANDQLFSIMHPVYEPAACDWALAAFWALAAVVLLVLAGWAFGRRKAEIAGIANTNRPVTAFVDVVFSLAVFGCAVAAISSLDAMVSMACALAAFALVSFLLLRGPLRGISRSLKGSFAVTGVATACVAAAVAVFATGGLGFSAAVPAASSVASVRVTYAGAPDYLGVEMDTARAGSGTYYYAATCTYTDAEAIQAAVGVQQALVDAGSLSLDATQADFSATAVPYDMVFEYTMTDGSTLLRYYDRATYGMVAQLLALDDAPQTAVMDDAVITGDVSALDAGVRSETASSLAYQAFQQGEVYVSDAYYARPRSLELTQADRLELLEALAADVAAQGSADRYYPGSACRGVIMFTQGGQADAESFAYRLGNSVVYLTDSFESTLAWFQENGLGAYLEASAADIESLTFQRYDPHASTGALTDPQSIVFKGYRDSSSSNFVFVQDWGSLYTTTDAEEIAGVLPALRNTYAVDGGGYLVCAKLSGIDEYSYFFLPADLASSDLKKAVG